MKRCIAALALLVMVAACASSESHAAARRQRLLEFYPPGTSRAQVLGQFGSRPQFSEVRPVTGWTNSETVVGAKALASERRTGHLPGRVEGYLAPDGWFSLCFCWFFYDEADMLVDAEWEWHTD